MKSSTRIKASGPSIVTREEAERAVSRITYLIISERHFTAEMDAKLNAIRDNYAPSFTAIGEETKLLMDAVRAWAEANPSEFGKGKSIEMSSARVGWRIGMPALRTLSGWTRDRVLERIRSIGLEGYIRVKNEVHKEAILADRENLDETALRNMGCKVVQEESFFVEPKITEIETRQTAEAK